MNKKLDKLYLILINYNIFSIINKINELIILINIV